MRPRRVHVRRRPTGAAGRLIHLVDPPAVIGVRDQHVPGEQGQARGAELRKSIVRLEVHPLMEFRKSIPQALGIQWGKHWVPPEARSVALTKLKPFL